MAMAFSFAHEGVLYLVLGDENLERIKQADPFVFDGHKVIAPLAIALPLQIVVCYCPEAEYERITNLAPAEIIEWLSRGWRIKPGDGNGPYAVIGKASKEI
jgi:hypothetical protein